MRLTFNDGRFVAVSSYEERAVPKAARFRWNPERREWWTDDPAKAALLIAHADETCRERLAAIATAQDTARTASRATDAAIDVPCPDGLAYLPFQRAGIAYALGRDAVLVADEMGLGKTVQAIGVLNASPAIRSWVVICPASLRLNWQREIERWATRPVDVQIAKKAWPTAPANPDAVRVIVVNFDVLHKFQAELRATTWDYLTVDEAHFLKNPKARRTQQVIGKRTWNRGARAWDVELAPIPASKRVLLTGTPLPNRPKELHPIAQYLAPGERQFNWGYYGKHFCAGYFNGYGWDFNGADHLDELQDLCRRLFMVRRLKKDVLTELPAKRRQVVELTANGANKAIRAEQEAWGRYEQRLAELRVQVELAKAGSIGEYELAVKALRDATSAAFSEIAKLRHDTAVAKLPDVIEFVTEALENEDKLVVFAWHHDVIDAIVGAFKGGAVKLDGRDALEDRQAAVDRFQHDPTCRVFVGSIAAAGVGLTLTAASHVIFAELDWVPGNLSQAEDRLHRIGQTNPVLVQHLVLDGSLDARMAHLLVEKQAVLDAALDDAVDLFGKIPALPISRDVATATVKQDELQKVADALTDAQVAAIHAGLRTLAGVCDGAYQLDGMGFNKLDAQLGHELATRPTLTKRQAALGRKLCVKYQRQLPATLLAAAGIEPGQTNRRQPR